MENKATGTLFPCEDVMPEVEGVPKAGEATTEFLHFSLHLLPLTRVMLNFTINSI